MNFGKRAINGKIPIVNLIFSPLSDKENSKTDLPPIVGSNIKLVQSS